MEKTIQKEDEKMKRSRFFRLKIVLFSVLLLAIIALIAAVCTTIAILSVSIARSHSSHTETEISLENKANMHNEVHRIQSIIARVDI